MLSIRLFGHAPAGLLVLLLAHPCSNAQSKEPNQSWRLAFVDNDNSEWADQWFLEGDRAAVERSSEGLVLTAGPASGRDSSHAVLWTHDSFSGDVRIEYTYTRLDTMLSVNAVNILFVQATGLGTDESPFDISRSTARRAIPTMSKYYLGMNSLHVSYATTGPRRSHYVSARRYPASSKEDFETGTQFEPIYEDVPLFEPGRMHHVEVVKTGERLTFTVTTSDSTHAFEWDLSQFPPIVEGRIGIRHMRGRTSRYGDFKVYERAD